MKTVSWEPMVEVLRYMAVDKVLLCMAVAAVRLRGRSMAVMQGGLAPATAVQASQVQAPMGSRMPELF